MTCPHCQGQHPAYAIAPPMAMPDQPKRDRHYASGMWKGELYEIWEDFDHGNLAAADTFRRLACWGFRCLVKHGPNGPCP